MCNSAGSSVGLTPLKVRGGQGKQQTTINLVRQSRARHQPGQTCHVGGQSCESSLA